MFRGLYTAGAALISNNHKLDIVGNNVANVNTTGFKKDQLLTECFENVLVSKVNGSFPNDGVPAFRNMTVSEENGVFTVSADGGLLRVQSPFGPSYSKEMRFARSEDGTLKTYYLNEDGSVDPSYGYPVLGAKGVIKVGTGKLEVDKTGNVLEDGKVVDRLVFQPHADVIGTMNAGTKLERVEVNFTQGNLEATSNPLDFALKGRGFFTVETPEGERFTRDGSFVIDGSGRMVTTEGYPVLGTEGPIVIDGTQVSANALGEILVDGQLVNKFKLADFENRRDLRKVGEGLYKPAEGIEVKEKPFEGELLQGQLESSNVEAVNEMIEMMTLYRNYESGQRLIRAYDDSISRAVNDIGKV